MPQTDVLQGTLDLLVLKTLSRGTDHGWGIAQSIARDSADVLTLNQGSLYPALRRLEQRGWIDSRWGVSENRRRARFYRLTPAGRRQLEREEVGWRRFSGAVEAVLAGGAG